VCDGVLCLYFNVASPLAPQWEASRFVKRFGNVEPSFGYKIVFHLKALSHTLPEGTSENHWMPSVIRYVAQDSTCSFVVLIRQCCVTVLCLLACWHLPQKLRWRRFWGSIWCAVEYEFVVLVGRWLSWRSCSVHMNWQCDGKYKVKNRTGVTLVCCTC
jgi:hypothetical protein